MTRKKSEPATAKAPRRCSKGGRVGRTRARRKKAGRLSTAGTRDSPLARANGVQSGPSRPETVSAGDKSPDAAPCVSLRFLTIQRAIYTLLEAGKTITFASIATEVGIKRQNVWKFFQRHPDFLPWIDAQFNSEHQHMLGVLARRMFTIAMQGSVQHADMFAKLTTGYYFRLKGPTGSLNPLGNDGQTPDLDPDGGACVINILVPHRDLPLGGRLPQLPAPSTMSIIPPLEDIPVVSVR